MQSWPGRKLVQETHGSSRTICPSSVPLKSVPTLAASAVIKFARPASKRVSGPVGSVRDTLRVKEKKDT